MKFLLAAAFWLVVLHGFAQQKPFEFRIRTITAGVTLKDLADTVTIHEAINFLENAAKTFRKAGYEVQTTRISTQHLYLLANGKLSDAIIRQLMTIDRILKRRRVILAVGEILPPNNYEKGVDVWAGRLATATGNISFSLSIASVKGGIHEKSIRAAAEICKTLGEVSNGGEANFRFTASANCPAGIPFFPAAFHEGPNSFAVGLEYPNIINRVFHESTWENADVNLKRALDSAMQPVETIAQKLGGSGWKYDGIDTSPAPGLDASIGAAIESLTKKPFGALSTLSACALITRVIKNLSVKSCGYSGLMLPVIEDRVLAQRSREQQYTVNELLLYSSVSGTGLDVVPIAGNTSIETIAAIYRDVAALSLKYNNKALSARLFPIPGKVAGEKVDFENAFLTSSVVMKVE